MKKYQNFLSESFHFLLVKFSYLNRRVFVMGGFGVDCCMCGLVGCSLRDCFHVLSCSLSYCCD